MGVYRRLSRGMKISFYVTFPHKGVLSKVKLYDLEDQMHLFEQLSMRKMFLILLETVGAFQETSASSWTIENEKDVSHTPGGQ